MTFENQVVRFRIFVVTVFWDFTSCTVIIAFCMMLMEPVDAPARRWPCACLECVSGLRRLKTTLNCLSCRHVIDLALKYVSEINERYWLQLLFYFISLMGIVASVVGMSFSSCVSGFRLMFSRIAFWRKRLHLDSKSDLTRNGLTLRFFLLENGFLRYIHICMA